MERSRAANGIIPFNEKQRRNDEKGEVIIILNHGEIKNLNR